MQHLQRRQSRWWISVITFIILIWTARFLLNLSNSYTTIKANTHGSAEAVSQAIQNVKSSVIIPKIIHVGVGDISEADIMLANASGAIILGFTVKEDQNALNANERAQVQIRKYDIIYQVLEDVEKTMISLLSP